MAQIGDLMPLIELIVISMLVSIFRNSVVSDLDNFLRENEMSIPPACSESNLQFSESNVGMLCSGVSL